MITTLLFIQLIAFQIWYITSRQVKATATSGYLVNVLHHRQTYRIGGAVLLLITAVLFIILLGWMSGSCAFLVGLMCIGGLVVLLNPFHYLNEKVVILLYVSFVVLEILI